MKTERELFQKNYIEKINTYAEFELSEHTGEYKDYKEQACWEMWLASKNREGYKLVPVEINDEIESAMLSSVARGEMPCDIYKAMIGVAT